MLSCAAIQKLERYGQLGLKRNNVEDFVNASLKDAKRANIYALTHTQTWQECLDAIQQSNHTHGVSSGAGRAPVMVSDALVYAVSFTTALVSHHLFRKQQDQLLGTAKVNRDPTANVFPEEDDKKVMPGAVLVSLLKRIMVQVVRAGNRNGGAGSNSGTGEDGSRSSGGGVRIAESKEFTQALTHLVSNVSVLLFYSMSVRLNGVLKSHDDARVTATTDTEEQCVWADGLVLLAAATRLLRRVSAAQHSGHGGHNNTQNEEPLFTVRSANALVKQFVAKHTQHATAPSSPRDGDVLSVAMAREAHEALETFPLLRVVLSYTNVMAASSAAGSPMASGFTFFENFSMLQKLSLLHGLLPDVTRFRSTILRNHEITLEAPDAAIAESVRASDRARAAATTTFVESNTQELLKDLLSSSACNKATRYVIYFRGDDLKLMQSKITQPSQYALHTFTTTPPVEPSLVAAYVKAMQESRNEDSAATSKRQKETEQGVRTHATATLWEQQQCRFYSLLFAQWIVSAPFFFEAFCSDPSWTAFAQEQRRTALLRQAQERRHKREDRRRSKRSKNEGGSETSSLVHGDGNSGNGGDDDATDTASTYSNATQGNHSIAPSLETSRSMLSLESRASLLSTLSKQSAATYMSFLSVLKPTGDDALSAEPTKFHESADGNTNLPLILLEELVLGLHRFMEAIPAEKLDKAGLRSLSWQSIGRLFAYIQDSISMDGSLATTTTTAAGERDGGATAHRSGVPSTIFNLGTDLRYNHGLGYESLGLLFAKVVAPQFETGQEADADRTGSGLLSVSVPGRAAVRRGDAPSARRCVEAALSRCLSAYEEVAPQVVDMNLPIILRIAARTAADGVLTLSSPVVPTSNKAGATVASVDVLYEFLAGIVTRLGKCNQVPVLLDALVSSADASSSASAGAETHGKISRRDDTDEDDRGDVAALQVVFSHPLCRAALIEASGLSMDPENLLGQLLKYVTVWSLGSEPSDHDNGEEGVGAHHQDPHHVLFVLKLVATVLEGLQPTSMTSSVVLERSTELELLLTAFAQKHLLGSSVTTAKAEPLDEVTKRNGVISLFREEDLRPKLRRQLWLHTLYAIYQCRVVTSACLRDLGLQNVNDYLSLLNDTLWQVGQHAGALLLNAADSTEEEDEENGAAAGTQPFTVTGGMGYHDVASQMSASTRMTLPPFTHVQTLLPMLALQRLSLARSVSAALGCAVQPSGEVKALAHAVLDAITTSCAAVEEGRAAATTNGKSRNKGGNVSEAPKELLSLSTAFLMFDFVNDISEEEWISLAQFSKKKYLRATLVALLKETFASPLHSGLHQQRQAPEASSGANEASRQREVPGYVAPVWLTRCLRCAGGAALRAMTDMFLTYSSEDVVAIAKATTGAGPNAREEELLAMLAALRYTYSVVGHVPYWPLLVERASIWLRALSKTHATQINLALLSFLQCTLSYEGKGGEILRRTLLDTEGVPKASQAAQSTQQEQQRRGLSRLYLQEVAVIGREDDAEEEGDEADRYLEDELAAFSDELSAFTQDAFTESYVRLLLDIATSTATTSGATGEAAMALLATLYHSAIMTCRVACREGRYTVGKDASHANPIALADCSAASYLLTVAKLFEGCAVRDPGVLCAFLQALRHLPSGEAALTAGLPKKSAKHKKTETAGDDVPSLVNSAEAIWIGVLRSLLVNAMSSSTTGNHVNASPAGLRCTAALYSHLLSSFTRTHVAAGGNRKESATAEAAAVHVFDSILLHQEASATKEKTNNLSEALSHFFGPAANRKAQSAALSELFHLVTGVSLVPAGGEQQQENNAAGTVGIVVLWLLYNLFVQSLALGVKAKEKGTSAETVEKQKATAAALVATVLTHSVDLVAPSAAGRTAVAPVIEAAQGDFEEHLLPDAMRHHGRLTENAFRRHVAPLRAATDVSPLAEALPRALDAAVNALALLRAEAAPPLLLAYTQALLSQSVAVASDPLVQRTAPENGLRLLQSTARAAYRLTCTPGVKVGPLLKSPILLLLTASTNPAYLSLPATSIFYKRQSRTQATPPMPSVHDTLLSVLQLWSVSAEVVEVDDPSLDAAWSFVSHVLEENNRHASRAPQAATISENHTLPSESAVGSTNFSLTQKEIMSLLSLLTRTWLPRDVLWRRAGQLPLLINALFEAVLLGVQQGIYERRVLSQVSSLFHQLVKLGIDAVEETADESVSKDASITKNTPKQGAISSTSHQHQTASYKTRLLCLAATVADMFQLSRRYITVFTTHSSDLDFIARDFLRALSQQHLPKARGTPIAHHAGVKIRPTAPSPATFADLVYTCVGDEEGKALLRQAAMRLDEEDVEQGGGGSMEGLVERRHIFNVDS